MATNSTTIEDEFGESDDWVELYNADNAPVNIGGMYITDDFSNPTKWQIPTTDPSLTTIEANGFILLWFDKSPEEGLLHVDMKLSSNGEMIGLYAADGMTQIDGLTFGQQTTDVSQGLETDGGSTLAFFSMATPGTTNEIGSNNSIVNMPISDFKGGHYSNEIEVTLTTSTAEATIRYTTNGDEPTDNSSVYDGPITIDDTTPLRARGFKEDMEPSRTMTHTYLYNVNHTFPIVCLTTNDEYVYDTVIGVYGNWMDPDLEQPVHIEFYEIDGSFAFGQDVGFSIHGNGSASNGLKGLNIIARSEYGDNTIDYQLFPNVSDDKYGSFLLRASGNDEVNIMCRDAMISTLVRDMDDVDECIEDPNIEMQAFRPSVVYLNGVYLGIQNIRDRYDGKYIERRYGIDKDEVDIVVDKRTALRGDNIEWRAFFDFFEENSLTIDANYDSLQNMINIKHFIDYYVFNMYVDNTDWPANNNRRFRERKPGAKWRYMVYDLDFGFGLRPLTDLGWNSGDWNTNSLEHITAENSDLSPNLPWSTLLVRRLFERADFRTQFSNRMADQLNILYQSERINVVVDSFINLYQPEIDMHMAVNGVRPWSIYMNRLKTFGANRDTAVWCQFENFFDEITDVVNIEFKTLPVDAGKIELNTMNILPEKMPWSGRYFAGLDVPISATAEPGYIFDSWSQTSLGTNQNTILNLDSNEVIVANFSLGSTQMANIVINEINYNSLESLDSGDWLELYNNSNTDVDVSAWIFEDESKEYFNLPSGMIIPANGYLVLVEDSMAFQTVYPTVNNFVGNFGKSMFGSFKLSNDAEKISISNADRSFVDTVAYMDESPWPVEADGNGPTLQLIHPDLDNSIAINWTQQAPTPGEPAIIENTVSYLECPENQLIQLEQGVPTTIVTWETPTPTSTCGLSPLDQNQTLGLPSGSDFEVGVYTITYEVTDICGSIDRCSFEITIEQSTSINDEEKALASQIRLYPNPTKHLLYLDLQTIEQNLNNIKVYNTLGQKITNLNIDLSSDILELNVADVNNGVYWVLLELENGLNIRKQFVVSR